MQVARLEVALLEPESSMEAVAPWVVVPPEAVPLEPEPEPELELELESSLVAAVRLEAVPSQGAVLQAQARMVSALHPVVSTSC